MMIGEKGVSVTDSVYQYVGMGGHQLSTRLGVRSLCYMYICNIKPFPIGFDGRILVLIFPDRGRLLTLYFQYISCKYRTLLAKAIIQYK